MAALLRASRPARLGLLALIAAAAAVGLWQSGAIWETLGFGVVIAPALGALLLAALLSRPQALLRWWHGWLGLTALAFAAWGSLAFYDADRGALSDASLGGTFGLDLIGGRDAFGLFVVTVLSIAGAALVLPRPALAFAGGLTRAADMLVSRLVDTLDVITRRVGPALVAAVTRVEDRVRARRAREQATDLPRWSEEDRVVFADEEEPISTAGQAPPEETAAHSGETSDVDEDQYEEEEETPDLQPTGAGGGEPVSEQEEAEPEPILQGMQSRGGWLLPAIEILDYAPAGTPSTADNEAQARRIEEAMASYGIEAHVEEINPGPTVTQFGVEPGWARRFKEVRVRDQDGKPLMDEQGKPVTRREEVSRTRVKVDAIANLDRDLAMALAAPSIRIEAPIPGKSLVGIEVPNATSEVVSLRGIIESSAFTRLRAKSKLAVALGKGSGGEPSVAALAKMPHLLIAGATGSGKSVCINAILVCLLMHATPDEVRLLLVDPKRVELAAYNSVPHLLTPVIVEVDKVVQALRWAIGEMEDRYRKFAVVGARNLEAYNRNKRVVQPLPYIVIAIDELADLMMAAPFDVEHTLTRLAQLGRATGIHLVVATQRPSVDVVTGLIKANFPTRMSFAVGSMVDSRTILDTGGAEKLLGKGDSLYLPQDAPKPVRVQGVFVSDREVERVVRAWNSQTVDRRSMYVSMDIDHGDGGAEPRPEPASPTTFAGASPGMGSGSGGGTHDPLYEQAKELADKHARLSASLLQRRLKIGYTKAKNLLESLEEEGYVDSGQEVRR